MTLRIANLMGMTLAMESLRGQGPVLEISRTPWEEDGWLGLGREIGWKSKPSRRKHRTLPNEYPKSQAVKRRRARNRMAAKSRRRNRS